MLRSSFMASMLVGSLAVVGCSEGTETEGDTANQGDDDSAGDDDAPAADDDATDDDAPAADDDAADDDAADDDAADDDTPAADDDTAEPTVETIIDVTTAPRDVASYETTKEYLTETAVIENTDDEGDPPPALRIELPYTNYNQFVEFQYLGDQVLGPGMYWDLTDKVLSIRLKVEADGVGDPMCPGGIRMFVKTGEAYDYFGAPWLSTPAVGSDFITYDFDLTLADPGEGVTTDPAEAAADVRAIGFGFESADCGGMFPPGDPAPEEGAPTTAVFYLEDITARPIGL
jgi:hypothetical protein